MIRDDRPVNIFSSLGGSTISWKSKKQPSISLSLAEVKYRSMRCVVAEITWLLRLLFDLSVTPSLSISLHSNIKVAIHITKNLVFHERTKHADLDCHFVLQQFLAELISLSLFFCRRLSSPTYLLNCFLALSIT